MTIELKMPNNLKNVMRGIDRIKSSLIFAALVAFCTWVIPAWIPQSAVKIDELIVGFVEGFDLVSLMFSSIVSFVGIFISALLVYVQVYINRFPSELVLNQIKPSYVNFGIAVASYLFNCVIAMLAKASLYSDIVLSFLALQ